MSAKKQFTVGLVQMRCSEDVNVNLDVAIERIRQAAANGAQLVCLPELFRSQYFCQKEDAALFDLAEPVPGPTTDALAAVAKELGVVVIAPVYERAAPGLYYNSVAILDADGSMAGFYRKMHIPDDPAYYEKFYFTPGDLGFMAFDTSVGRIAVLICWDQWYPEGARLAALDGASIIFYPTAIGWHPYEKESFGSRQRDAWRTVQRGHAIANGVYVAGVNRTGHEVLAGTPGPGIEFFGYSFLSDPFGAIVTEAGQDEAILYGTVDLDHLEDVRRNWPFIRDRRIDEYDDITCRWRHDDKQRWAR